MRVTILISLLVLNIFATAQPVSFKIKNFGFDVQGSFDAPKGEIRFDPLNPAKAHFDVSIDASTINTGIELRDRHLKKQSYLDAGNYPVIRFVSSQIIAADKPGCWKANGRLLIKKVAKDVSIVFTQKGEFLTGEFIINRRDFDVGGKNLGMDDEVMVYLNVKL